MRPLLVFLGLAMFMGIFGAVMVVVATAEEGDDCPIALTTHNIKGSHSESVQERHKHTRGCWLKNEVDMVFGDHTDRYRYWCCHATSTAAKRSVLGDDDDDDEPEQEDDLDQVVEALTYLPWGLNRLDQRALPLDAKYNPPALPSLASQQTVHVYVMGSGIDATHSVFDNVAISMDYPSAGGAVDCCGHETRVASIIAGYATGVIARGADGLETAANIVLHSIRVLGCDCTGTVQDLLSGLAWIQNNGPRPAILSMSIGAPKSASLNSAISSMTNSGDFLAIVAAGNDNTDACTTSPPSASNVVVVGATAESDGRASYSNYGSCLDIFAPGSNIYGALMGSGNQLSAASGSSFATPHVTGLCARYLLRNPNVTSVAASWTAVRNMATLNAVSNAGPESPNLLAYSGSAPVSSPPAPPRVPSMLPPPTTTTTMPPPPSNSDGPLPQQQTSGADGGGRGGESCHSDFWFFSFFLLLVCFIIIS